MKQIVNSDRAAIKTPLDAIVSLFPYATNTTPQTEITIRDFLGDIKNGKYKSQIDDLRKLVANGDAATYIERKKRLPGISLSARLTTRAKETPLPEKLISHTHVIQGDIDKVPNYDELREKFKSDPHILFVYQSPSGQGLKTGIRIDGTQHLASFQSVEKYFLETYGVAIDANVKDVVRLCFASYDPDLYVNESAHILPVSANGVSKAATGILPNQKQPCTLPVDTGRRVSFGERAINTARQMIEHCVDGEKHNTLLKAGKLLGGYVAGGIISESEAENCLRHAIEGKPNVQCLTTAYKTIKDSLQYGQQDPIGLDELERQRVEYLEANGFSQGVCRQQDPPPIEWPEGYTQGGPPQDDCNSACVPSSKNESKEQALCFEDVIKPASVFVSMATPEKETYLSPWLNASSIIGITGWRGVGKSLFTEGVVDAVTKAAPFGPWPCENPDNCLIVDGEMAVQDGQKRISDLGTDGRKAELYYYSDAWGHSKGFARASLLSERWRDGLAEYMLKRGIKVWVCDNVASLTPGIDENSKSEWDPINQFLLRLRFSGITTILVHHEGKQGTQRGTSAREDNLDVCISLRKPSDYTADQGARFIVHFTKSRIPLEYLPLIADHEFQLIKTIGDTYEWTWANARKKDKKTILKFMDEGLPQNDIAVQCGVTKGRISQIKTEAIREGLLTKSGRLTQPGCSYIYDNEN